jgi:hypothetical protein
VNDEVDPIDQMPLVRIVGAPEEIQTGDHGYRELRPGPFPRTVICH